jgi:hypothetical protein
MNVFLFSILNFCFLEFIIHIFVIISFASGSFLRANTISQIFAGYSILINLAGMVSSVTFIFITARSNPSSYRILSALYS